MAAIEKVKAAFAAADPNEIIYINGTKTTIGEQLAHLENTQFVITDEPYENGGPGGAFYNADGGPHRVEFNFEAFDGDMSDGKNDYADPKYSNMEGVVAMIGHEMGHVSDAGDRFYDQSRWYHDQENNRDNTRLEFHEGQYWANNESWAHSYSKTLAGALNLDIEGWTPTEGFDWIPPKMIYDDGDSAYYGSAYSGDPALSDAELQTESTGVAVSNDYLL